MIRSVFLLMLGVVACASAAVMLKVCTLRPEIISALRLLLASLVLCPLFLRERRRHGESGYTPGHARRTWAPAVALAGHFILWAYGAHVTLTAQASLIVNLVPVALPFFLYFLLKEHINKGEILATVLALIGLGILTGRDAISGTGNLKGNLACFGAMLLLAWYMTLSRRNRDFTSVWLYVVPVYFRAGLICLVIALPHMFTLGHVALKDWLLIVALALIPTVVGHSLINLSMRTFRGQIVSLANVSQFLFAGLMGWIFFAEFPAPAFFPAAVLVLAGVFLAIRSTPPAITVPAEID